MTTHVEDTTALNAIEVEAPGAEAPPKAKRFTHMLLDNLGRSQHDLSVEVGRSKCYSFVALLSVAVLLGAILAANIAGYELVKETEVNDDDTLKTRDGNTVKVALVADKECPLVELLGMTRSELTEQKVIFFSSQGGDGKVWSHVMKPADYAIEVSLPAIMTTGDSKVIVRGHSGTRLELEKILIDSEHAYRGEFTDDVYCADGCSVIFCSGVNLVPGDYDSRRLQTSSCILDSDPIASSNGGCCDSTGCQSCTNCHVFDIQYAGTPLPAVVSKNAVQIEDMLIDEGHCDSCDLTTEAGWQACIAILDALVNGMLDTCGFASEFDEYAFEGC